MHSKRIACSASTQAQFNIISYSCKINEINSLQPPLQVNYAIPELFSSNSLRDSYPLAPCELRKFFAPQSSFNDVSTYPGKSNIELFCLSDRFASDSHISLNLRTRVGIKGVTRHEAVDGGAQ